MVGAYKQTQQRHWLWWDGCRIFEQAVPACLLPLILLALVWLCGVGILSKQLCRFAQAQKRVLQRSFEKLLQECRTWMTCLTASVGTWNRREPVMPMLATMVKALVGNLLLALACQEMKIALDVPAAAPGVALGSGAGRDSDLTLPPVMHRRDHLRLFRYMELLLPPLLALQTLTCLKGPLIRVRSYGRRTFEDAVAPRPGLKEAPLYGGQFWLEIAQLLHNRCRQKTLQMRRRKVRRKKNQIRIPLPPTPVAMNVNSKRMLRRRKRATFIPRGSLVKFLQASLVRHPGPRLIRMMVILALGCRRRTRRVSALQSAAGCFSKPSVLPDSRGDFTRSAWQSAAGPLTVTLPHSPPSASCAAKQQEYKLACHSSLPGASKSLTEQLHSSSFPRYCQAELHHHDWETGTDLGMPPSPFADPAYSSPSSREPLVHLHHSSLPFQEQATPRTTTTGRKSRLGPNSQGVGRTFYFGPFFWIRLLLYFSFIPTVVSGTDARVESDSHPVSGAFAGEHSGGNTARFSTFATSSTTTAGRQRVRKRAYARAMRRARQATDGTTMYRGRVLRSRPAPSAPTRPRPVSTTTRSSEPTRRQRSRLRTLSLNLGGMDTATFDCFMQWLPDAPFDIIALQEVHHGLGKQSSQWSSAGWTFVTCIDSTTRFQGLATLVRQDFMGEAELHQQDLAPGRLLHVRIARAEYHIDVLNFYQHAYQQDSSGKNLSKRHSLWDRLNSTIQGLARRNLLVVLGDFNCTPIHVPGHTGYELPRAKLYADAAEFSTILEANQLIALNTWTRRRSLDTFVGSKHKSLIDFALTRRGHADLEARQSKPLKNVTFSPWRLGGKHFPVQASFPLHPGWQRASVRTVTQPRPSYDLPALNQAVRDQTSSYQALRVTFEHQVSQLQAPTLQQLNDLLLKVVCKLFPKRPTVTAKRAWQTEEVRISVADMWRARKRMQRSTGHAPQSFRQCFQAWLRHRDFQKAYKALKRQGKETRKAILEQQLVQAREAVRSGDHGQLHRIIRQLAPKTQRTQVRIHGRNGEMLTYQQEHQAIIDYFEKLFQSHLPAMTMSRPSSFSNYQVTPADFEQALRSLKAGRAVPSDSAPSSSMRACADVISRVAAPQASSCLSGEPTPSLWSDCSLAMIPKPHKPTKRPENLRPLGLQDAGAKAYAKILKGYLLQEVNATLKQYPLHAYIPGRNTDSAISRVTEHCRAIRAKHQGQLANVHTRRARVVQKNVIGGLQLAIDLSTAFDMVPRDKLLQALIWAGSSDILANAVLDLHQVCRYSIQHRGRVRHICMRRGVRQGCTLAPLLWAVYSAYITHHIAEELTMSWVSDHLTLYADDTHASWTVESLESLKLALKSIPVIFRIYRAFGMQVNPLKSGIIIGIRGVAGTAFMASHIHGPTGNKRLVLGPPHDQLVIPIKDSMTYLGIQISYGNFEDATLDSRLAVAHSTRGRLLRVLHARRYLTMRKRLQLYFLCVRTAATYGLLPVGVTSAGFRKLHVFEVKHVRAIARSPVHLTRETNFQLYARLKIQQPGDSLIKQLAGRIRTLMRRQVAVPDSLHLRLEELRNHRLSLQHGLQEVSCAAAFDCPTCGQYFTTLAGMRSHHTRMHGRKLQADTKGSASRLHGLRVQEHCVNQMPICKHCGCTLTTWHQFRVHILSSCVVLHSAQTERSALQSAARPPSEELARQSAAELPPESDPTQVKAPFEHPSVQKLLAADEWKSILQLHNMKAVLQHHCILCNQWFAKAPGSMASHVKAIHPDLMLHWDNAMAHSLTLREGQARPCHACGAAPRGRHRCRVLHQLCLMLHHWRALRLVSSTCTSFEHGAHNAGSSGSGRHPAGSGGDHQPTEPGGRGNAAHLGTGETGGAENSGGSSQILQAGRERAGTGLAPPYGTGAQPRLGPKFGPMAGSPGQPQELDQGADEAEAGRHVAPVGVEHCLVSDSGYQEAPSGDGADAGTDPPPCPNVFETRRRAITRANRARFCAHFRAADPRFQRQHGQHVGDPLQDGSGLEGEEGGGQGGLKPSAGPLSGLDQAVYQADHHQPGATGGPRTAGYDEVSSSNQRRAEYGMALPEVESGTTAPGGGSHGCPVTHGPDDGPVYTGKLHHGARGPPAFSLYTQAGGKSPVSGDLSGFDRSSGPQKPAVLQGTVLTMLQRQLPASQAPHPPGQDGASASGKGFGGVLPTAGNGYGTGQTEQGTGPGQGAEDESLAAGKEDPACSQIPSDPSRTRSTGSGGGQGKGGCRDHHDPPLSWTLLRGCSRPFLRLSLRNPGNLCYVHAILQMFIWFSMIHDTYMEPMNFLGRLLEPCGHLRQVGGTCLLQSKFWLQFLRQWRLDLTRQQDAAEFLVYMLEYATPVAYNGQWQARTSLGALTFVHDSGHTQQPILLEIHQHGLQASIQQWHMQPYPHALREAPIVLFFQLKRWSQKDSHRPVNKDLTPFFFEVGATFDLPLFESARGLQVQWLKYRLVTVLLHTGMHPWAGHYRSILSGCRQLPNGNARWTPMLTDDDRAIRPCTAADMQHAFSNCYLLGLCREV